MSLTPSYTSSFITRPTSPALSTHSQDTATLVTGNYPLSTDLSSTLAGRADGSDRETLTVDWSVANTDSDSGSIEPRDPKGGSSGGGKGGGGKSGKSGRKGSREKTNFGKAFKNRFNTKAVKDKFQSLRAKAGGPDPRRTLRELLDLVEELLQNQTGDEGHYKEMEDSLEDAIAPEGSPLDENKVSAAVKAYDDTVKWLDGEKESAAAAHGPSSRSLLIGVVGAAVLVPYFTG